MVPGLSIDPLAAAIGTHLGTYMLAQWADKALLSRVGMKEWQHDHLCK